jgi:hypothetical protein
MKIIILSLRHTLCIALFVALNSLLYSQGNLQFNQVLTYGGTLNAGSISANYGNVQNSSPAYTVPSGKVWKIESVMTNGTVHLLVNNLFAGGVGSGIGPISTLWLKAGDVIRFGYSSSAYTYFFSGIEFNIIP